jgi:hypothetical protein
MKTQTCVSEGTVGDRRGHAEPGSTVDRYTTGKSHALQASMLPIVFITNGKPARFNRLLAIELR